MFDRWWGCYAYRSRDQQVPICRSDQNQTSTGLQVQGERIVLQSPKRPVIRVSILGHKSYLSVQTPSTKCLRTVSLDTCQYSYVLRGIPLSIGHEFYLTIHELKNFASVYTSSGIFISICTASWVLMNIVVPHEWLKDEYSVTLLKRTQFWTFKTETENFTVRAFGLPVVLKGPIHDQSCCTTLRFVQHDWSCMVLIDLIVNGQTCVGKTILRNMIDRVWAP
jgi:hypothetical protein